MKKEYGYQPLLSPDVCGIPDTREPVAWRELHEEPLSIQRLARRGRPGLVLSKSQRNMDRYITERVIRKVGLKEQRKFKPQEGRGLSKE